MILLKRIWEEGSLNIILESILGMMFNYINHIIFDDDSK